MLHAPPQKISIENYLLRFVPLGYINACLEESLTLNMTAATPLTCVYDDN